MTTYNQENFISLAISTVLAQTFEDYELVIIDDCSTDSTVDKIKHFTDPRIRLLQQPGNKGAIRNGKDGLSQCRGEYVAYLSGDDYWITRHKLAMDMANIGDSDMIHSGFFIESVNDLIAPDMPLKTVNPVACCTAVIRSEVAKTAIVRDHWMMADYPRWLNCETVAFYPIRTAVYRQGVGISSGGFLHRLKFLRSRNEIARYYGVKQNYTDIVRLILKQIKDVGKKL